MYRDRVRAEDERKIPYIFPKKMLGSNNLPRTIFRYRFSVAMTFYLPGEVKSGDTPLLAETVSKK